MVIPPAPTPERWKQITQLTAEALERPEAERSSWLADACAGDEDLRLEVESLLAAHCSAGSFLETGALAGVGAAVASAMASQAPLTPMIGRRIGPYRILSELGHGGMGVVYLAERADAAFEKKTAIKVVRGGLPGELLLQRFRDERRILATLEHPNIARLLDGGTTEDGLPYVVMEYVDGVPLDVYCETARPSLVRRLQLFREVCAAVQFAHQRLVIHRDLKPRNILVTADGTPKLLDFGIAKLLQPGAVSESHTQTGLRPFTLDAASPEQIRGEPMTVSSDVYALGVLLYHLMTGQHPYGPTPLTDPDLMRAICENPPVRPTAAARNGTRFDLSIELEWVVLKALRKEPDRRYGSVEQLAEDIRRYLSGLPVLAAPDSRRYRARKFAVRNRKFIAAGSLLILSLVAGLTATLWQARLAERQRALAEQRFQNARRVASSMVFELHDAIEAVSGATAARALLLTRASEQLDALALDAPDDPMLLEELAVAYHRLGDVQGLTASAHLGDQPASRANHRKGLALRRILAARSPDDLEARARLVSSLIGTAYAEDQVGASLEHAQAAVTTAEFLLAAKPKELRFRRALASAHYALGSQYRAIGDTPHALASFEQATPLYQAVYDSNTGDTEVRRSVALCHKRLGAILLERDPGQAVGHMRRAIELDEASLASSPMGPRQRRDLSTSNTQLGFALWRIGDAQGALVAYRRALSLREGLMRDDAKNVQAPHDVSSALYYIGVAENGIGNRAEAIASFQRAMPLAAVRLSDHDDLAASIMSGLADTYEGSGRLTESLRMRRQALEKRQGMLANQPRLTALRRGVVFSQQALGATLVKLTAQERGPGQQRRLWQEARAAYDEGLRVSATLDSGGQLEPADTSSRELLRVGLARCDQALGRASASAPIETNPPIRRPRVSEASPRSGRQ
jgi:non-specific serine/threonine protein kinase/serine/threonine-protein kinase